MDTHTCKHTHRRMEESDIHTSDAKPTCTHTYTDAHAHKHVGARRHTSTQTHNCEKVAHNEFKKMGNGHCHAIWHPTKMAISGLSISKCCFKHAWMLFRGTLPGIARVTSAWGPLPPGHAKRGMHCGDATNVHCGAASVSHPSGPTQKKNVLHYCPIVRVRGAQWNARGPTLPSFHPFLLLGHCHGKQRR